MQEDCLHEFTSHIEGKNAVVRIFPDRIEWDRTGGVSKGKAWLGVATVGLSLAATGFRSKKGASEMIPVKSLTSVTTEPDRFQMRVRLIASGNTIDMRVSKEEAAAIRDTLTHLMLGTHPAQHPPLEEPTASPTPQFGGASPPPTNDVVDQIRKLAELRDAGILSDDEFEAKKQDLLSRM